MATVSSLSLISAKNTHTRTHAAPGVESNGQNIFFLEVVMLHVKLKGMEHSQSTTQSYILSLHKSYSLVGSKGQNVLSISDISHVAH